MNVQRIMARVAIGGIVLGAASVAVFGAGAAGVPLPDVPRAPVVASTDAASPPTTATDPATVISECMAGHGFAYNVDAWRLGEPVQPHGLSYEESISWLDAYYGDMNDDWSVPITDWRRQGCVGFGLHAAEVAGAAGTPLVPEPDPEAPTWQQLQREFRLAIQSCMAERGLEYRIPEFGEYGSGIEDDPAMPEGLPREQGEAWLDALWGNAGAGAAYRWEDAGCQGYATHVTGNDNLH
ncbi:hypothetical protein [Agromyces sp. NPDC049794]|uniref:hypothetical protein n=1 Tax=unclassified Agromyces TaxID=2639701 RepID=UPI0033CE492A